MANVLQDVILTKGLMHVMDGILSLPESVTSTALKMGVPEFIRLLQDQKHDEKLDNNADSTFFIPKELIHNMPTNTIELSDIISYVFRLMVRWLGLT